MKYYDFGWEWHMSLPVNSKFTKIDKNVKYALEYSERLVSKQFLILLTNYHDIWSHLVLVGTGWPQLATGTPCGTHGSRNKQ